ncbi:MAG: acyl-ACP--UDP-N-acetylglucosamine O-acyltransferase [Armatimonadota bacterium]|nr:acyl-ACP--UDP-N-acetylglucosamine O-acyltransferase [Armatimonadota bacterium]MDR7422356.1 acyl-ACP--UDP-N-acetylglucosamine O-acyltransferase [Armatimonadota bacterium]MDR7457277.1 acyl-ACP--UDP-N-acetylglucosamine O-acyltransferase [Armatimonadota bacterium]MDR7512975.1 acyl-ACP--UDP-N-acetylglucosamine O-acyltransferase [Armatimonadota bacterium]
MADSGSRLASADVHPTAVVHTSAHLGEGVEVGAYAVVGAEAVVGDGTVIGPHAVLADRVTLGRRNRVGAHTVIGSPPQDRAYRGEPTRVVIGDDNHISEFASIDRATGEGHETRVGNGTFIMSFAKVSHNCWVGDRAIIVSGVQLGGWVRVDEDAYLGGLCGVHQFTRIGRLAMVAGNSGVRQDVPPYVMVAGWYARAVGLNRVGMQRRGVSPADRLALRRAYRIFFESGLRPDDALAALEAEAAASGPVGEFLAFLREARAGKRGVVRCESRTEP